MKKLFILLLLPALLFARDDSDWDGFAEDSTWVTGNFTTVNAANVRCTTLNADSVRAEAVVGTTGAFDTTYTDYVAGKSRDSIEFIDTVVYRYQVTHDTDVVYKDNVTFQDSVLGIDEIIVSIPAGSWDYTPTNFAPLDKDLGTNFGIRRQLFDKTTAETLEAVFQVPDDVNNTDSLYIDIIGYATTAGAAGVDTVRWIFLEKEIANAKPWDVAYAIDTLDKMLSDGQDSINISSTGRLASDFGWAGGEFVMIRLVRLAGNASDVLDADYGLVLFTIRKK